MPKIFNIDFSAVTKINSVSASTILNLENITFNDDGSNMVLVGNFKGFNDYRSMVVRLLPDGTLDNGFNVGEGFFTNKDYNDVLTINGSFLDIQKVKIDSSGNYFLAGSFYQYSGVTNNRIIKLFPNGTQDTSFNSGLGFSGQSSLSEGVKDLIILPDGKLLVAGQFSSYNNIPVPTLVRLNSDGSLDNTFNASGATNPIFSIALDSIGNILFSSSFLVSKLLPNGDFDPSFTINNSNQFSGNVNKIALDSSDNIYAVGGFTTFSGVSANRIVKLLPNGVRDTTFVYGTGFNNTVNNVIVDSSNKIYVRGAFTTYNGATNNVLIKLNADGTKDTSFSNTSTLSTANASSIGALKLDQNGKLLFGGQISTYFGVFVSSPIRLNTDGSLDTSFNFYGNVSPAQLVYDIEIDSLNNLIICGRFNSYKQPLGLYSLKTYNGKQNTNFNPNYGFTVSTSLNALRGASIVKSQTNNLYIGGYFENYTLPNSNYRSIAVLGLDLSGNPNNSISVNTGANNTVTGVFEDNLGGLFIMGAFTNYKGVNVPRIVKINQDASIDNTFNRSGLQSSTYLTMKFDSSNNIYLGGAFTTFSGQTNNFIIKLFQNGFKDPSFDNTIGFNSQVNDIFIDNYGKILVVGAFTTYKNITCNSIVRLNSDGSIDNTFDNSIGFDSTVSKIGFFNNKIYLLGSFNTYKNKLAKNIIRLNYDGSIDETFNTKSGIVGSSLIDNLKIDNNGNIYILGTGIQYQNYDFTSILRLKPDGSKDPMFYVYANNFRRYNWQVTSSNRISDITFI